VKCLRYLQYFPRPTDAETAKSLNEVLRKLFARGEAISATDSDNKSNAEYAILFESCNLVILYGPDGDKELKENVVTLLGNSIGFKDANIRSLGLDALDRLTRLDGSAPSLIHQATVIASLKDKDISVRKRALDPLFAMTDECAETEFEAFDSALQSNAQSFANFELPSSANHSQLDKYGFPPFENQTQTQSHSQSDEFGFPLTKTQTQTQSHSQSDEFGFPLAKTKTQTHSQSDEFGFPLTKTKTQTQTQSHSQSDVFEFPLTKTKTQTQSHSQSDEFGFPLAKTKTQTQNHSQSDEFGFPLTKTKTQTQSHSQSDEFGFPLAKTQTQTQSHSQSDEFGFPLTKTQTQTQSHSQSDEFGFPLTKTKTQTQTQSHSHFDPFESTTEGTIALSLVSPRRTTDKLQVWILLRKSLKGLASLFPTRHTPSNLLPTLVSLLGS
jgi:hypothetical protein